MATVFVLQLVAMPVLLVAAVLGCAGPYVITALVSRPSYTATATAFAAGVLLAAALTHLLPDALKAGSNVGGSYPLMYALACAAFVGMLSLEVCVSGRPVNEHEHDDKRWVSTSLSPSTCSNGRHTASPELSPLLRQPVDTGNGIAAEAGTSKSPDHASSGDGLVQVADDTGEQRSEKVIVLVLLFGLVSHSVLAGLVLGIETHKSTASGVFVALMAHKFFAGFSLGSEGMRAGLGQVARAVVFGVFACAAPLGIGVGMAIHGASASARAILQALAAGVFLYMGSWHMLQHTLVAGAPHRRLNMLAFILGSGIMALLAIWA